MPGRYRHGPSLTERLAKPLPERSIRAQPMVDMDGFQRADETLLPERHTQMQENRGIQTTTEPDHQPPFPVNFRQFHQESVICQMHFRLQGTFENSFSCVSQKTA